MTRESTMETLTTQGIRISVEPFYLPHESIPIQHRYVFAYRVTILNQSPDTVQLLRRHWHIVESNGVRREVEGEGIVGLQPMLAPGESHQEVYWWLSPGASTGCNPTTPSPSTSRRTPFDSTMCQCLRSS